MDKVRPWRANFRCPVCGLYDHGGKGSKPRCVGFLSSDEETAFCSTVERGSAAAFTPWGKKLYAHHLRPSSKGLMGNAPPPPMLTSSIYIADQSDTKKRRIVEETKNYPEQGIWRPAETKHWFVIMEGEKEITRSLRREVAESYLHKEES